MAAITSTRNSGGVAKQQSGGRSGRKRSWCSLQSATTKTECGLRWLQYYDGYDVS